ETEICQAWVQGQPVQGHDRSVRSQFLIALIHRLCFPSSDRATETPGHFIGSYPGLVLENTQIQGKLDLSRWTIAVPLLFHACTFDSPLQFQGATLQQLDCSGSVFPSIQGSYSQIHEDLKLESVRIQRDLTLNHLRCQGPLNLNHSTIGGTLHLAHAQLGDSLYLRGIQLAIPTPRPQIEIATQEAAPAPSLDTGKDSASIANSATESTAESTTKSTTALTTELATELAANPESTANPAVNPATKPSPGSDFTDNPEPTANPAADPGISTAINAPNLQINHSLYLQDNFCIHGQVHLSGAILGQALEIGGGQWLAPNDIALQASGLRVRHLLLGPSLNPDAKSQGRTVPQPLESHQDPHVPLASPSAQSQTQRETSPEAPLREAPLRMIGQVIFAGSIPLSTK
ncbi:MAG: hypothetical protein ACO4CG_12230, partial [Prochlorothrix sp.]